MTLKEKVIALEDRVKRLQEIGLSLSTEDDINVIFELIMEEAKNITNADGRTLYMISEDGKSMKFEIMRTDSMNFAQGGTTGVEISIPPMPLFDKDGNPNHSSIVTYSATTGKTVNVKDAYTEAGFDFTGAKNFDKTTGYRTTSVLSVPLKNHENDIVGVMQLINATDKKSGKVVTFSSDMQQQIESLASQGAVALTNKRLVAELKNLFESFIKLIATAIDKKSPYTGGHCERVPEIAMMLAEAVENTKTGKYADFAMTDEERYELYIAAWLHDCGKVATPPHVVDKGMKLETITDRIETVDTRFEVLKRDAEISMLRKQIELMKAGETNGAISETEDEFNNNIARLIDEKEFIRKTNRGGEFMEEDDQKRVADIGKYTWESDGELIPFLDEKEVRNLQIPKGTLLPEEREIINDHIVITIDMLEKLPYPKNLKNVPEFAGGHHEKLDGTGYPKGLKDEDMSTQAKIMAIADIYEALTAADRPYKDGKKLSMAMRIMGFMKKDYEIDKDLFEIFVKEGVYKQYAEKYVKPDQIDQVDEEAVLK
ncbi:MAG: HD domain-containing phosphohydrolase [Candidatus Marinimicrobia bacterium]|jgi:HD-GYP domain-containing protein (c-di-GMP phosphodiesterase class II)|nr:HD domain-containing phosphohydrolase [Candidatus Neomarinimicrobiota bacterium]MDP6852585.1 HD domain-containing phosphohydrolase [Candidatus Neomarinimicrobiota bacterium]MDP6936010.1 HD domain-containing phosphohydrolase [Candidatus Neomarinimicrobiota bacterium]